MVAVAGISKEGVLQLQRKSNFLGTERGALAYLEYQCETKQDKEAILEDKPSPLYPSV